MSSEPDDGETDTHSGSSDSSTAQDTPLPGQQWCANGHLCADRDNYCRVCGDALSETDADSNTKSDVERETRDEEAEV